MDKVDEVFTVGSEDAVKMSRRLFKGYGVLVGISSGANMLVAQQVVEKYGYDKVVTVLPDRGERYLSMDLLKC